MTRRVGIAQMATKQHAEAEDNFIKAKKYAHARTVNEKLISLYQTLNALHAGNYQAAYQLYRENRKCKFENIRQQFAIIEAYMCFLSQVGYLQLEQKVA